MTGTGRTRREQVYTSDCPMYLKLPDPHAQPKIVIYDHLERTASIPATNAKAAAPASATIPIVRIAVA